MPLRVEVGKRVSVIICHVDLMKGRRVLDVLLFVVIANTGEICRVVAGVLLSRLATVFGPV